MKRLCTAALGLLALAAASLPAQAEWGWPPPGYSATGISACDGSRYRGLCAVIRDRHRLRAGCLPAPSAPCDAVVPAAPGAPQPAPQPPPQGDNSHR